MVFSATLSASLRFTPSVFITSLSLVFSATLSASLSAAISLTCSVNFAALNLNCSIYFGFLGFVFRLFSGVVDFGIAIRFVHSFVCPNITFFCHFDFSFVFSFVLDFALAVVIALVSTRLHLLATLLPSFVLDFALALATTLISTLLCVLTNVLSNRNGTVEQYPPAPIDKVQMSYDFFCAAARTPATLNASIDEHFITRSKHFSREAHKRPA